MTFDANSYDFVSFQDARHYIGGEWVSAAPHGEHEVINPRFARSMGKVQYGGADEVAAAVRAAKAAQPAWAELPLRERATVFYNLRQLMMDNLEELTWLVSHENGKTYEEAKAEVLKGVECVEFGCSLPNLAAGTQLEVSRGVTCEQRYEPIGVVAGVTPFNFPLMVPLWMLPQALVGGNAFVLKPSEQVPLSMIRLAELFEQAGLPRGIFNVVNGGKEVVEALCDHEGIGAMAFVGSTKVAKLVYGRGAQSGKRMLCLGGAKNHLIVVPDADLELTADNVLASFTGCAGQRCMAAAVMVAVGDVDDIIGAIAERATKMQLGRDLGAITNQASVERITGYIESAEKAGARILVDGRGSSHGDSGYWVGPTVLDGVPADHPAAREEIFGPVLSIVHVPTLEAAIDMENRNPYGNASAVYTTSGEVARRVMSRVEAGMCGVNVGVPVPREPFGFGGWNDSKFGHGNITGWDGYRFWTRVRKITSKWALQKDTTWMS
ncbi:MAG: CoA-acylating methylmalonate-semialdehyde dehydrogenase [Myxococcales bacterium]|nr:CoA-acylating methylmalonate-semialdehyde dehydrogenase [Myxococcales bacterium]MCB9692206.1 CoA-acylating methylmalonate-semialdehyde dehydrogenase [Alphaproteobacteria bacterium]